MSQNSIDHLTMEIRNNQPSTNNIPHGKPTKLHIFKHLGPSIRTFLGSFCERTAIASLLRKKCVVLLSIFLCSGFALEMKTTINAVPSWFCILYICLAYQILEDIVRWSYVRKTNHRSQEVACIFEITHKIALTLFLLTLNMKYEGIISEGFMLLTPLIFLLETALCWKNYSTSHSQNIVPRLFYILQSSFIAAKMNNMINLEWKITLIFLWIYLGINALYAILAGLLYFVVGFSSFINFDREYLSLLKNEAIGYIWHICYNAFSLIGIVFLIGYFAVTEDLVKAGLYFAQKLSLFLGIYTVVLFPLLRKQTVDVFQDLLTMLHVQVTAETECTQEKYTLVETQNSNKKEFFLKISSTYFSLLKDTVESVPLNISEDENLDISQETPLCYICENNESDAIIKECGHGGVCCNCVVKSMECKNECMECRKPVTAIYRIETHSRNEGKIIVEASEFAKVLEV